jgi:hypothetical protein
MLIDKLYKEKLNKKGILTYHQDLNNFDFTYKPKFYNNKLLTIDDNFVKNKSSYEFNETYLKSFLHIPTESSIDTFVLSEKTATPILCKLPFLTVGSKGYHKELKNLGFKLYDEIFDYSFDKEEDISKRIDMIINNVKCVVSCNNLQNLYNLIKHKLDYNRTHALTIISDYNCVPTLIKNHYNKITRKKKLTGEEDELIKLSKYFKNFKEPLLQNKELIYDLWSNFNPEKVEQELGVYKPKKVIILGENEWEPWVTETFKKIVSKNKIQVIYTTASAKSKYLSDLVSSYNIKNFDLQYWPNFYFIYSYNVLNQLNLNYKNKFKYSFVCLNNISYVFYNRWL